MKELANLIANLIKEEEAQRKMHNDRARECKDEAEKAKEQQWYAYANFHTAEVLKNLLVEVATKINIEK